MIHNKSKTEAIWTVKSPAILRGATAEHVLEIVKLLVALAQV